MSNHGIGQLVQEQAAQLKRESQIRMYSEKIWWLSTILQSIIQPISQQKSKSFKHELCTASFVFSNAVQGSHSILHFAASVANFGYFTEASLNGGPRVQAGRWRWAGGGEGGWTAIPMGNRSAAGSNLQKQLKAQWPSSFLSQACR